MFKKLGASFLVPYIHESQMYSTSQTIKSLNVKHDKISKQQIPNNLVLNEIIFYTKVSYRESFKNTKVKKFSREKSTN